MTRKPDSVVQAIGEQFPALRRTYNGQRVAYLDSPGGSQVTKRAIDAVAGYMTAGGANLHGTFVTSRETEELIHEAPQIEILDYLRQKLGDRTLYPGRLAVDLALDAGGETLDEAFLH